MELLEIDEDAGHRHPRHAAAPAGRRLERQKIIDRLAELERLIADLEDILANEARQRQIVCDELTEIVEKYGDERRTQIIAADGDLSMEDLIPDEDLVVSITRGGYAKRTRADQYRTQKRGGKGVRGATLRGDDVVAALHRHVQPPLAAVLHHGRPGLPHQGLQPARGVARREGRPRRRAAQLPARREHRAGAGDPRLRAGALPRARHPQRPGQEDPAGRLQQPAPGRRDRDQLPRGRRRADRRRAGRTPTTTSCWSPARARRSGSAPTTPSCGRWAGRRPA